MALTVGELKEILEFVDDDVVIRFAAQPSWPMEYSVEAPDVIYGDDDSDLDPNVFYLAEKSQLGYLPSNVSQALGWK